MASLLETTQHCLLWLTTHTVKGAIHCYHCITVMKAPYPRYHRSPSPSYVCVVNTLNMVSISTCLGMRCVCVHVYYVQLVRY